MKKVLLFVLAVSLPMFIMAQDPAKDIKKAARSLGSYHLDPSGMADKLAEAVALAESSIHDPIVAADASSWFTYGEVYMAALNKDVSGTVLNEQAPIEYPGAPAKAFQGFKMTAQLAEKGYQTKDAMKALSDGLQNIYYLGSILYQRGDLQHAYEAFKATHESYSLLKANNEATTFDPAEYSNALKYTGLVALEAGLNEEAIASLEQTISAGLADASIYEALIGLYREKDPAKAEQYLAEAREKFPNDTNLLYSEINYYLAKGELVSLVSKLEKAVELEPNNVSVYVTLGQIYDKLYQDAVAAKDAAVAQENFDKAMGYYNQAMAKDAKNFDAVYSIGALWYNQAAAYSVELNELASDYTPAGNKKYDAKKAQMDDAFNKALPFFLQAEELNGKDYNTLVALKEIYARQNKLDLVEAYKQKLDGLGN